MKYKQASARAELLFEHMRTGEGPISEVKITPTDEHEQFDEDDPDFVHAIPRLPSDNRYEARKRAERGEGIWLSKATYSSILELSNRRQH
mmetsp:Transcript_13852/g.27216  ORF Transcript_13852/g.27216 Transcript_13852/m.27216 type:complete len:90 (-) Transcript_13852:61-330(-)